MSKFVLVPKEPTPEMTFAGMEAMLSMADETVAVHPTQDRCRVQMKNAWAAMLAAAPPPAAGGMKSAEEWTKNWYDTDDRESFAELVSLIQADARATQPEARPLRELIADGCEEFWVWVDGAHPRWFMRDKSWAAECVIIGREGMLDCPAIPIPKPTVTL